MKAAMQFTFSEEGEVKHTDSFTIDVSPAVADVINNDKAPYLTVGIFPTDPRMGHEPEVIDLEKLYPDVDLGAYRKEYMVDFVESVPAEPYVGIYEEPEIRLAADGVTVIEDDFPPTGQVRREDEGAGAIGTAARLVSAPAGWPEGQPYDRWDQIIDEMDETDGAWNHFTTTRAEVRRAMQKAVGEDRLAQLDAAEYGRDDLNPDPSGDFKDIAFITTPYSDLASSAYAAEADRLETPRVGWAEEDN